MHIKMAPRELTSRARLEVAFETHCPLLVLELNDDVKLPGPVPRAAAR